MKPHTFEEMKQERREADAERSRKAELRRQRTPEEFRIPNRAARRGMGRNQSRMSGRLRRQTWKAANWLHRQEVPNLTQIRFVREQEAIAAKAAARAEKESDESVAQ